MNSARFDCRFVMPFYSVFAFFPTAEPGLRLVRKNDKISFVLLILHVILGCSECTEKCDVHSAFVCILVGVTVRFHNVLESSYAGTKPYRIGPSVHR